MKTVYNERRDNAIQRVCTQGSKFNMQKYCVSLLHFDSRNIGGIPLPLPQALQFDSEEHYITCCFSQLRVADARPIGPGPRAAFSPVPESKTNTLSL